MVFLDKNTALIVLILALVGLLILIFKLWLKRQRVSKLTEDASGLWRYHRATEMQQQLAFGKALKKEKTKQGSDKDSEVVAEDESKDKLSVAVIRFDGDLRGRQHWALAKLVDEVVVNKERISEVVIVLNSSGGMVSQYGHAYAELERIRRLSLKLTVCIDVVAASGGYLMSLPANKIVASPFAVVGSVGVMAFVPNIRNLLTSWRIQPRTFTAGSHKQTVSLTGEDSAEDVANFQGQLETIHRLFLEAVKKYRPGANLDAVSSADHWTAAESVEKGLGLVDELATSQEYLMELNRTQSLVHISHKRGLFEDGLGLFCRKVFDEVEGRVINMREASVAR